MSEYREKRRREIRDYGPFSDKKPEVVMTQWVDDECYLVIRSNSNEHVPTPQFDKSKALDEAEMVKGIVLVIPCIRSHQYRDEQHAKGFVRCPYFSIPRDRGSYFQGEQCSQECGHTGPHGVFGDYRNLQHEWKVLADESAATS